MDGDFMRIVSLCPSNTEILVCLGLMNQIVGVDHYSDWPKTVKNKPDLGPDLHINMEKVVQLQPDLIVASKSVPGMEKVVEQVRELNIPYLVLEPYHLEDIFDNIIEVGIATERLRKAKQVVDEMKAKIEWISERVPKLERAIKLYWEWWPKPVISPGEKNWLTDVSEIVGAKNIFAAYPHPNIQTDWERVAQESPDYVLAVWTGIPIKQVNIDRIISRPAWQGKRFVERDRVHILEEAWFCRPSPRLITGIEHLAHILYPKRFFEATSFL